MKRRFTIFCGVLLLGLTIATSHPCKAGEAAEISLFSARTEDLIRPLITAFTEDTGIRVKLHTDKAGPLLQNLKAKGEATPADVLLTVDAGNLWQAATMDLLKAVESKTLSDNIPAHLRDPQGRWYGLTVRARTMVYHTGRVEPGELSSYANLADPAWRGRVLLRTSSKVYNQSLVAMMIADLGEKTTEATVKGWVANLATDVFSSDSRLMDAIIAGQGDVGIVNTYYFGALKRKKPDAPLALFWPDQDGAGVHINISGGAVVRHSRHPDEALKFLVWMSEPKAQEMLARLNMEYPANPAVSPDPEVAAWGAFKANETNLAKAGELQRAAVRLMDRAGWK